MGELLDSVYIAYDDLRIVNSKLIELDYEKQINSKYKTIVYNDSIVISELKSDLDIIANKKNKYKKQRNISFGVAASALSSLIILLIK